MTRLRLAATRVSPPLRKLAKTADQAAAREAMIALDDAYTAATGTILTQNTAPHRPSLEWHGKHITEHMVGGQLRWRVISALFRLRDGQAGCHPNTLSAAIVYFDAIWPEGAIWPASVTRPTPARRSISA